MPEVDSYAALRIDRIVETIQRLERRIGERFPDSGLKRVGGHLAQLAAATGKQLEDLRKPVWPARAGTVLVIAAMLAMAIWVVYTLRTSSVGNEAPEVLQGIEAAVNLVVFLVVGIYGTVTLETRYKRRAVLRALYQLRGIIHVVDMHQLTKDPETALAPENATASSPDRRLSPFELARYLDYCSELLSLTSKVAALYLQDLTDGVVHSAVNDIETLASSLSQKIWQKIMILDVSAAK